MKSVLCKLFKKMLWAKEESEQGKTAEWLSKLNVKKESEHYESGLKPNFSHKPFYTESRLFHTSLLWGFLYSCKGQIPVTVKDEICELGCMNSVKTNAAGLSCILRYLFGRC